MQDSISPYLLGEGGGISSAQLHTRVSILSFWHIFQNVVASGVDAPVQGRLSLQEILDPLLAMPLVKPHTVIVVVLKLL